jgi:hypothetical protein
MIDIKKIINLVLPIIVIVFASIGLALPVLEKKSEVISRKDIGSFDIPGTTLYLNKACELDYFGNEQTCVNYSEVKLNENGKITQAIYALTILIIIISGIIFILQLLGKTQTVSYLNILVLLFAISNLGLFSHLTIILANQKFNMAVGGIMLIIAFCIIIISNFALNSLIHKLILMLK